MSPERPEAAGTDEGGRSQERRAPPKSEERGSPRSLRVLTPQFQPRKPRAEKLGTSWLYDSPFTLFEAAEFVELATAVIAI